MEIFGKITRVLPILNGTSANGTAWTKQSYIITDPNNPDLSLMFTIFGNERIGRFGLKEGIVGTLLFSTTTREYNGSVYNEIRFEGFRKYGGGTSDHKENETPSELKTEGKAEAEKQPEQPADGLPF